MNHDSHVHSRSIQTDSISYVSSRLQQRQWLYGSMPAKHVNILRLEWMNRLSEFSISIENKNRKEEKKNFNFHFASLLSGARALTTSKTHLIKLYNAIVKSWRESADTESAGARPLVVRASNYHRMDGVVIKRRHWKRKKAKGATERMAALLVRRSLQFKLRSSFNNVVSNATRETFTSANRMEKFRRKEIKIHSPALFFFLSFRAAFSTHSRTKKGGEKIAVELFYQWLCHFGK